MTYIKHQTIFHINNAIVYGMFHVMHEMRLLMPTTRVLTDSLTPAIAKCGNHPLVFNPMTYTIGQPSNFNLSNLDCLFGLQIFGVSSHASQRLPTLSRTFIAGSICLTKNKIWVVHPRRGSAPSCFTQTHVIYSYYYFIQP